jgi:hypothetical protein
LKSFETRTTWLIIIGLLIFGAIASVVWPAIIDSLDSGLGLSLGARPAGGLQPLEPVPLPAWMSGLPGMEAVAGDSGELNPLLVLVVITAVFVGLVVGTGLVLGILLRLLDRQTRNVKADSEFQAKLTAQQQREKERFRALAQEQPPSQIPDHERPRWSRVATSLVILFFIFLAGFAMADTFYPSGAIEVAGGRSVDAGLSLAGGLTLLALLLILLVTPRRRAVAGAGGENRPVSWNMIWVIVTGLVFLGIGIGLTLAMRVVEVP